MRSRFVFSVAGLVVIGLAACVVAQQPGQQGQRGDNRGRGGPGGIGGGGGPGGGGFGGFITRLGLLRNPAVSKELELADEQIAEIEKISDELRAKYSMFGGRGPGGPGGGPGGPGGNDRRRGGNNNNNEGALIAPAGTYFISLQEPNQQQGQGRGRGGNQGGGFQFTPEQRAEMEKTQIERAREERAKISEVLLPHQIKRLTEIYIQQAGMAALRDEEIAKELGISDAQKAQMTKISEESRARRDELFGRGGGGGGGGNNEDFEARRAKMIEFNKAQDDQILAVLSAQQKAKFEEMKGKPFAMPEGGRGFGGPGGPGGRGPGAPGGGRGPGGRGGNNNN